MDRRYQVFISSTYMDLVEERREVIQALLEMDCLPAGMEMFPAANDDQWTLIQQVIDESDYYVVIVGGRYGSVAPDGISYTEKEYDYAVSTGKPVLGFVHANPGQIPLDKSQPTAQKELDAFAAKVKSRLVKMYSSPAELGSAVSRSLIMTMKKYPAEGWVRGQYAMTPETQAEMAELRALVSELRLEVKASSQAAVPEDLASGTDPYTLHASLFYFTEAAVEAGKTWRTAPKARQSYQLQVTWNEIIYDVGPLLINEATREGLIEVLNNFALSTIFNSPEVELPKDYGKSVEARVLLECFDDIVVQLFALGIITHGVKKRSTTDKSTYWALTGLGQDTLMKLRAIRKGDDAAR
ncbi:hypothetical protein QF038_001821 [Pseudarthrobacter sp. W1I19]|uniref:DUF4062 domain-containing protein n=1 Tax=Pseudarthrobacter sp. W1I19 TaxID=3042288 RepID=UPI002788DCCE|nr:DUF4062 domain-containing protein [Pseudarthrobacter sp. W1I19]MDQ0923313.1 hypothetical protein [Pseudarthrobacter sp. W1I19]